MKKTICMSFTAGVGPTECAKACEKVFTQFANENIDNYYFRTINTEFDHVAGIRSITIELPDLPEEHVDKIKEEWEGTVKVIATKNSIRPNHKRKNWFVGVHIEEIPEEINLDMNDVRIDRFRASGPGGQHVNTTDSAVRLTHIPTEIAVTCDAERSQIRNLEIAKKILSARIKEYNDTQYSAFGRMIWEGNKNVVRGMAKKVIKTEI